MNSIESLLVTRVAKQSSADRLSAFRTALEHFGAAAIEDFLPAWHEPGQLEVLCDLVLVEMRYHWRIGKKTPLEAYEKRFADLFADPVLLYRLAREEFLLRQGAGEAPTPGEYQTRFELRDAERLASASEAAGGDSGSAALIDELEPTLAGLPGTGQAAESGPQVERKPDFETTALPDVGDTFLGFELLAELGRGGFGRVFLAKQPLLAGRLVALKVATGLFSESQTLAQLQHTYIVPIHSYHRGHPYQAVCMPYLGSTTLAHVLADIRTSSNLPSSGKELLSTLNDRKKKTARPGDGTSVDRPASLEESLPDGALARTIEAAPQLLALHGLSYVESVLWLAVRLAEGLAHAHERGVIHRDLKPANILITDDGQPMLLDFNLAQHTLKQDGAAARASIGGTLPYMAPEHLLAFRGAKVAVDARCDLYALGVILFELLTGASPFPSYRKRPTREVVERMIADRREGGPSLRRVNIQIPPAVEAIVRHCLEADPACRYQTARELQEDLQRQLDHLPLRYAGNPSLWERGQKLRRRHPRLASMTSVAAVAAVMMAALGGVFAVREEQRAGLEARATLTRFEEDVQSANFLLNARSDPHRLEEGQRAGLASLAHFGVLENSDWHNSRTVRRLSAPQQERLQEEVGQVLVLLAHAQQAAGAREADPTRRTERLRAGLQYCSLASSSFPADRIPQALWKQRGELHKLLDEGDEADRCFEHARQADLKTVQDRYLTARALAEEGKFREALPLLREAVRLNPRDFNLHFLQGICHDYLVQNAEAIGCYRACIVLRPRFYGAYYNRGLAYLRQHDFQAAREDFDQAIRLRPDFDEAYPGRASAHEGEKKYVEAIADLTTALERGFLPTQVYFLRARLRESARDLDGAKKDRAEGMRREPTDEDGWIARGLAFLPTDPKEALHSFEKALEANPRSLAALQNKAHVLGKYFKRTEEAITALDKAVELYPDDCRPRAGRGVYLGRLGKRAAAIKDAEQSLLLDTSPSNLYQVAGIYALTSRQEAADRHESMRLLSSALKSGFGFDYLEIDRDLDPIRDTPAFRRIVDAARALQSPQKQ